MIDQTLFFRDTWAEINVDALSSNMKAFCDFLPEGTNVFAAVKANAYGHGDVQTAKAALQAGAHGLLVAMLDEALALRKAGIKAPILVLGAVRPVDARIAAAHHISLTVFQLEWLEQAQKNMEDDAVLNLHLKCDTGMGRLGVKGRDEINSIEEAVDDSAHFCLEGIYTHFATADQVEESYYAEQLGIFKNLVSVLKKKPKYVHAANSAAALYHHDSLFNSVRIGIALYGLAPSPEIKDLLNVPLQEVLSLHSSIVHVKKIEAGESIGYGATYTATEPEWIATIPIGYADGWIRALSGFEVIAGGMWAPIVGRICMDQMMIKLPEYMPIGTKVTLIGRQGDVCVSADDVAKWTKTINYEVTCLLSSRVPRVYMSSGKPIEVHNQTYME